MTETEWNASTDPLAMLEHLHYQTYEEPVYGGTTTQSRHPPLASLRKLRLFACACCRAVWPLLTDPRSRHAVEVAERYADGAAGREELVNACHPATAACPSNQDNLAWVAAWACSDPSHGMAHVCRQVLRNIPGTGSLQSDLLREIAGNPFRPFSFQPAVAPGLRFTIFQTVPLDSPDGGFASRPVCQPSAVARSIAQAIYAERDFSSNALGVLADALEDDGCADEGVLSHLRSQGPHCRGCHVLDLLLGKE